MENQKKTKTGRLFSFKPVRQPKKLRKSSNGTTEIPETITYRITNNTGAYLHCVRASDHDAYTNTWFGSGKNTDQQVANLSGIVGDYWVFNFYKNYGVTEDNIYYGTVTFAIKATVESSGYSYFGQDTSYSLWDRGVNSSGIVESDVFTFNWGNGVNFDPYTAANYQNNSFSFSDANAASPNLFSGSYGLVGLNADWAYFPSGSDTTFSLEIPEGFKWGPASDYTYFLTNSLTQENQQYVWFPEQPARGNYTITLQDDGQQLITQVAPYQNGNCWSRAYGALTQNSSTQVIDSAEAAAAYGLGATYGKWSIDFCAGDSEYIACESFYLTERPYLSPESVGNYVDGQSGYLEVDGIETYWQNEQKDYPEYSDYKCLQGSAWCGNSSGEKTQTKPFPVDLGSDYLGVWVRCTLYITPSSASPDALANISYTYDLLNEDGSVSKPIELPNGKTYWSLIEQDPDFCKDVLTPYLEKNPDTKLYPYLSTWCASDSYIPDGYSVTTKYKNYTYSENWE